MEAGMSLNRITIDFVLSFFFLSLNVYAVEGGGRRDVHNVTVNKNLSRTGQHYIASLNMLANAN